jgi:hypothetical protein
VRTSPALVLTNCKRSVHQITNLNSDCRHCSTWQYEGNQYGVLKREENLSQPPSFIFTVWEICPSITQCSIVVPARNTFLLGKSKLHIYSLIFKTCLRPLQHWDRGFESHWRHRCLCVLCPFILCLSRVEAGKNTSTVIPASRKRRQKGNPVVSGETVPADLRKGYWGFIIG